MGKVKDRLRELDVKPSKGRGQNFLLDDQFCRSIASCGTPLPDEEIVEIGPGLGALTKELVQKGSLTVIEIESRFCSEIRSSYPDVRIVNADVREVDFSSLLRRESDEAPSLLVYGNVPYSFSTDIVFHLIENRGAIRRAILLLQKEFGARLGASPGGKDYGVLSVNCQMFADVSFGPIIGGGAFHPPAKVDSMVVILDFLKSPRYPVEDIAWFKRVVRASFQQRRKKLHNSLKGSGFFTAAIIDRAFQITGIDKARRAETLSIEEFWRLSDALRSS